MQKFLLLILLLILSYNTFGQTKKEKILEIVQEGISYHDEKKYDKAIAKYKEALVIDSKSALTHYEIAMTYAEVGNHKKAVYHANKVLKQKKDHLVAAYMVKGNVLDEQGNTKASIKLFKKALKKTEGHYLLNYNLGINYFKKGDIANATTQMVQAIQQNPAHSSSHLYLALTQKREENVVPSALSAFYFLLLEPKSNRAKNAYDLLSENLGGDIAVDPIDDGQVNITIDGNDDNPYQSIELIIGLLAASKFSDDNTLSKEAFFINSARTIFTSLSGLDIKQEDIWTKFYIPFFDRLEKSPHFESYCYYILQGSNRTAEKWCDTHPEELKGLFDWLNE